MGVLDWVRRKKNERKRKAIKKNDIYDSLDVLRYAVPLRTGKLKDEDDVIKHEDLYDFKIPYSATCKITDELLIATQEKMEGRNLPVHRIRLYLKNIKKIFNEWERDLSESK